MSMADNDFFSNEIKKRFYLKQAARIRSNLSWFDRDRVRYYLVNSEIYLNTNF